MFNPLAYFKLDEVILDKTSETLCPAFSIKILGIHSKDLAYLSYEYYSNPFNLAASSSNLFLI
jgi:hypothetical protein